MTDNHIAILISDLKYSVDSFHKRFGLDKPATQDILLSRIPIQDEEVRELDEAIRHESWERIAEEAVDVLYVALGTLTSLDQDLVARALREVIEKNNAKNWTTHHLSATGKVVRR